MDKQILDTIFRAYDIRGRYPSELNSQFYENLGKAYVTFFKPTKVAVGYDIRPESIEMKDSLAKGLCEMGCDVVDIGEVPTEALYFATGEYPETFDGGLVVTASHNGAGWNGCKMVTKNAKPISGTTGLMDLKKIILENRYEKVRDVKGAVSTMDVMPEYKKKVLSFITSENKKPLKIVVDAGNGIGGKVFDYIFCDLENEFLNVERMYFDPDGTYPNHVPNPMEEENVEEIKKRVVEKGADFGIAIDGDADRAFFIDNKGRRPDGVYVGVLLAKSILSNDPGNKKIIHDPRITWPFVKEAQKLGAKVHQSMAGHSFFKAAMAEKQALFGAEASAHFYYRDFYNCDSGMVTIAQMLNMYFDGFELTQAVDYLFENYPNSGEVNYRVENAIGLINQIEEFYKNQGAKIEKIDGLSVEFEDWRFNLRTSNTQPLLRINLEAKTKNLVIEKFLEVENMIGAVRDNIPALEELR
ncbi:MAG TPA: phosphomannomutase/phosphoglucomutase [bacterium]|nr:phosphomannomutase/phosphoglucomutase [bacterium]